MVSEFLRSVAGVSGPQGVFDGRAFAARKRVQVTKQAVAWRHEHGRPITIASLFPYEDDASVIYTKLKQKDAESVGMQYQTQPLSLKDAPAVWQKKLQKLISDPHIEGILIQKPSSAVFQSITGQDKSGFATWWSRLVEMLPPEKDVDGLTPTRLLDLAIAGDRVERNKRVPYDNLHDWVLPATSQAVIDTILFAVDGDLDVLRHQSVAVIGQSVIVGRPVVYGLRMLGVPVQALRSQDSLQAELPRHSIVVAATGVSDLVQAEWIQDESILIDVGAPKSEFSAACYDRARFWTPVPYGIGPVTRACLLENAVKVAKR